MSVSRFPRRSLDSYLVVVAGSRHDVVLVRKNVSPATHAARGGVPFVRDDARSENPVGTTREAADRRARATQGGEARRWMSRGRTWFSGSWFSWYTCRWWSSPMAPAARVPEQRAAGRPSERCRTVRAVFSCHPERLRYVMLEFRVFQDYIRIQHTHI